MFAFVFEAILMLSAILSNMSFLTFFFSAILLMSALTLISKFLSNCFVLLFVDCNGFCYLKAFNDSWVAVFFLGRYPSLLWLEVVYSVTHGLASIFDDFDVVHERRGLHVQFKNTCRTSNKLESPMGVLGFMIDPDLYMSGFHNVASTVGSTEQYAELARDMAAVSRMLPITNDIKGTFSRFMNNAMNETSMLRPHNPFRLPKGRVAIKGDETGATSHALTRPMNKVSAMEASKVLLSGMESLGSSEERTEVAMDAFAHGIATAVAPSSPAYSQLLSMLGPLRYTPKIEAHPEAATIRRAAMNHALTTLEGAIVALVSPSNAEVHAFPRAVIWAYQDGLDVSRMKKHCSLCKLPRCQLVLEAKEAGRYYGGNDWKEAAGVFRRFEASSMLLMNIEPNMDAHTLTKLMVSSGVFHALSLVSVDWRAMLGRTSHDNLINMTTELSCGKVVSSFSDGGDYVQSIAAVKQVFAPTFAKGHALRRTVIFGNGASQYFELTLNAGGWATRCVPEHDKYYFIRLIMPDLSRPVVLVERRGFDRVLATYRTQAIKDRGVARIVLRQSVVTYSISGTQVTPRISLTASEAEALGVWIEIYSEVQDKLSEKHAEELRPKTTTTNLKSSVFNMVASSITSTQAGAMALGSYSSVEALLRVYRTDVGEMTLDQMSDAALVEHFGTKVEPLSLQNIVVSAWQGVVGWVSNPTKWFKLINDAYRNTWRVSFSLVDAVAVTGLLGVTYSVVTLRVVCDCVATVARVRGDNEAVKKITELIDLFDWQKAKVEKVWVNTQNAQNLDFQAATIDIVESFFNVFGRDHAVTIQEIRERQLLPEDDVEELAANMALPVSDFLSEIKLFLGKFNSNVRRAAMSATILSAFQCDRRACDAAQREKMIHVLKKAMTEVVSEPAMKEMAFALGKPLELKPIPLRPIRQQDIRECFEKGSITLDQPGGEVILHKLNKIGDTFDFAPIHALMDLQHGDVVNMENLAGPSYLSPDEKGSNLQQQLITAVVERHLGARFVPPAAMTQWYAMQLQLDGQIDYVRDVLREQEKLFSGEQQSNWIAHITGLAMGGKSKQLRSWLTSNDLVVVPTVQLKLEWQENLGKQDPVRRATVVTQHEALRVKYASRYVLVDECYAFDPEHLQAIANRHRLSKGVITIGDKRQISNVFSPSGLKLVIAECPCVMITPTTFVGWDAACVYLQNTVTDSHVEHLFCGSDNPVSLQYTLSSDETLLEGENDKAIQGTQIGKELATMRGLKAVTVHEAQGSRTTNTIVHGIGRGLIGDLRWLGAAEQQAHMGVLITRARKSTVFVVDSVEAFRHIRWHDELAVNGELSSTVVYGGTAWDLVEPRAESESIWEHLYAPPIAESYLEETPLTDPVSIATVFAEDGEPLSSSEIRTNVELVSGVTFRDDDTPNSDAFDNYCIQPRDVPGADMVQALTRSVADVKPRSQDFADAEKIVEYIFEDVIDKKKFFAHVANSRRAAINRQTRQQVVDGCYASTETAASVTSFAFLKPEFAKKPSDLVNGPSELKAQGVVSASDMQQALFADVCDALTHAWARSQQQGKLSPVGLREAEVEEFLGTFERSYELDIEKQDSSHKPVHIIVAGIFLEMASEKLGLATVAHELRMERRVRMMGEPFKFILNKALASGDPWTLIINKIMAVSSLISVANLKDVRMCQSGDDVTLDREPCWRGAGLREQAMANVGLTWKMEEREQRRNGVTFISRAVLPHGTVVYKALRTILKYAYRPRNSIQHAGIAADALRVQRLASKHGLQAYAEARCQVWGGDPVVVFDLWVRALQIARCDYQSLPEDLKKEEPRHYSIRERNGGCFGYALGMCVKTNVQAINAIATYQRPVTMTEAKQACRDNKVPCLLMNEKFALRSRKRLQDEMDRHHFTRSFVVVYEDHAVAVVPNTLVIHSGFGKREVKWVNSQSKDVVITDFE